MALQAFSAAVAPLPGVPTPEGAAPSDYERLDGTFAINWITQYLDQLTPEQRAVVDAALKPSTAARLVEPLRAVAAVGAGFVPYIAADDPAKPFEDAIAAAESTIAARLHRDLKAHIFFDFGEAPVDPTKSLNPKLGDTLAFAYTYEFLGAGYRCEVRATHALNGASQARINAVMAHEVFHCFQLEVRPDGGNSKALDWIIEGQAEWAGEDVGGTTGDGASWWSDYLKTPQESLFGRTYDAVGFYEHLAETGTSPWTIFDKMLATPNDSIEAFKATGATEDTFLDTWASGIRRETTLPAAWYAQGRWSTTARAPDRIERIQNGSLVSAAAAPVTNTEVSVESHADITELAFEGHVRMHTGQLEVPQLTTIDLCTNLSTDGCTCPKGTSYDGPPLSPSDGIVYLAITGSLSGSSGTIQGRPLSDFCKPIPSPRKGSPAGGLNPCAKGCAGSIGDPHMDTIDQQGYDFQAAGEYTLLRSPDGAIEIQGRQVPYPDIPDVSINSALAWKVAGHKVGMYADQESDTYSLWLDGTQLDAATLGTQDLGSGAALTALDEGIEVAYGDGTIATAFFHGNGFAHALDVQVAPSDAFRTQAVGLLGPIAAGSELPAMPDGTALPLSSDRATRFAQRYQQLAPAWHVTDQTSLFDYQPGQTTASFDVAGFPSTSVAFTVDELKQQQGLVQFEKAAEKCAPVAADQEKYLHCVFDIMATKDPAYADFYAQVEAFLANGPTVLDGPTVVITQPPPPTPSSGLPAGIVQVAGGAGLIKGSTIGPDGVLYASILKAGDIRQLVSVNMVTGQPGPSIDTTGTGRLFVLAGSLWAAQDDPTGYNKCTLLRLDPVTLAEQSRMAVGCDIAGVSVVPVADGIWWLDRSTSGADGHGAMLRHVDQATNAVDRSVELPFVNGYLSSTATTVFFSDPGDEGWYRLRPGETALTPLGLPPQTFSAFPGGAGIWFQPVEAGSVLPEADFVTGSAVERRIPLEDGSLVAADERAVYVERQDASVVSVWRYPIDGSAPTVLASGASIQTASDEKRLSYLDNDPLVITDKWFAKLWLVYEWPAAGTSAVLAQATALP